MNNIFKNFKEYNPNRECKILIVSDGAMAYMVSIKKL